MIKDCFVDISAEHFNNCVEKHEEEETKVAYVTTKDDSLQVGLLGLVPQFENNANSQASRDQEIADDELAVEIHEPLSILVESHKPLRIKSVIVLRDVVIVKPKVCNSDQEDDT